MRVLRSCFCVLSLFLAAQGLTKQLEREPRTEAAVRAADDAWGEAEKRGDADFVEQLLLPEYRSIGSDGKITSKAVIVDHTRARGASSEYAKQVDEWKTAHPERAEVRITGDTAVLTWVPDKPGAAVIFSCDIFVYRSGRWHGIYSQHTSAGL
jgi:hypothetical protein